MLVTAATRRHHLDGVQKKNTAQPIASKCRCITRWWLNEAKLSAGFVSLSTRSVTMEYRRHASCTHRSLVDRCLIEPAPFRMMIDLHDEESTR